MDKNVQTANGCAWSEAEDSSLNRDIEAPRVESEGGISFVAPATPRLPVLNDPAGVGAEKFRLLATRLRYLQKQQPLKQIVITSTMQGEGKSVISANLSITLARRQRTLL